MAETLTTCTLSMGLATTVTDTGDLSTFAIPFNSGTLQLPALDLTFTHGTGADKANAIYYEKITVGAAGSQERDLRALTDRKGAALVFNKLKLVIIRLRTPAAGVKLVFGNAAANSFQGWLSAGATEDVHGKVARDNPVDGWTVDATHKQFKLANPGGAGVDGDLILIGEK